MIGLDHLALLVGDQIDGEIVLRLELVVFLTLSGDRPITTAPAFSNSGFSCEKSIASLRAAGGVVLRIEVEDDRLAGKGGKAE